MTTNEPAPDQSSGLPSYGSTPAGDGGSTPPPPPPGAPGGNGSPSTNKKAIWSLVLGILSILCCTIITGIPALILGRIAKREIAGSGAQQTGGGMATAGVVLGIISIVLFVLYLILVAVGAIDFNFYANSGTTS